MILLRRSLAVPSRLAARILAVALYHGDAENVAA